MAAKTNLKVVPKPGSSPPGDLGHHGALLWRTVMAEYRIEDSGGREMLAQACKAAQRAEDLSDRIKRDGPIIAGPTGPRDHPGLKHELANRTFVVRTLARLGLDVEAIKPMGRPPRKFFPGAE